MLLTDAQLHEIRQIIADYHNAFVVNVISPDVVEAGVLERLKALGLVNTKFNVIEDSYLMGQILAAVEDPKLAKLDYSQFKAYVQRNPVPLTPMERRAVQIAQHQAAQYAVGLGKRVDLEIGQTALTDDAELARKMRDTIRTATAESLERRETAQQLKSKLGNATGDWARDWDRIAITEMHTARQKGTADHYAKKYGPGVLVAKRPMPDACDHCKRLYLGPDGHPRIFKLSQLEANGTNVKKKAGDWRAVLGSVHPWCRCETIRIPEGWGFSEEGALVPGGTGGVRYGSDEDFELALKEEMDLLKSATAGHVTFQGIPITIESQPGSIREWTDSEGNKGQTLMLFAYGFVDNTDAIDGDELDVYVGPDPRATHAYVIHQQNPKTGTFDESKIMLGFGSQKQAVEVYREHFDAPDDYFLDVTPMEMGQFKRWASSSMDQKDILKKAQPEIRFVIPLQKSELQTVSGQLATEAITTRAGDRAPGPTSAVNFIFPMPVWKENVVTDLGEREVLEAHMKRGKGRKRNKKDYEFDSPLPREPKPVVLPDNFVDLTTLDLDEMKRKKEMLIREGLKQTRRPQNKVEIE